MNTSNSDASNKPISIASLLKREHKPEILENEDREPTAINDLDDKTAKKVENALDNL